MAAISRIDGSGVEVILEKLSDPDRPQCPHGPTILFERYCNGRFRRFFACSSNRDRKQCDFYQTENDSVSDSTAKAREGEIKSYKTHAKKYEYSRLENARQCSEGRKFCRKCHILFNNDDASDHENHPSFEDVTDEQLQKPTVLLAPLENNKSNAQYLFSEKATQMIIDTANTLKFTHVLCIGTPTLHESIGKQRSLLLDIDYRMGQFYDSSSFCHYNMFNHHFFDGDETVGVYEKFLSEAAGGKLAVVIDPPFGGLVDLINHTLSLIESDWSKVCANVEVNETESLSIFWIFPYFLEPRVCQKRSLHMLDYKVDYMNHDAFQDGPKGRKLGSPVRIFTNVEPKLIVLPQDEGYRYCERCERYVAKENEHCRACKSCPSKDGSTYIHCDVCERCVKPSRTHCYKCNMCVLPNHACGVKPGAGCFICGDLTHKRRDCPQKKAARKGKRVVRQEPEPETVARKKLKTEEMGSGKNKHAKKEFQKSK